MKAKKKQNKKKHNKKPLGVSKAKPTTRQQQMFLETKGKLSKVKYQRDPVEDFIHTNTEE